MSCFQSQLAVLVRTGSRPAVVLFFGLAIGSVGSAVFAAQDDAKAKPPAQTTGGKSVEDKLSEAERERDDLKRRNAELEQRLKQLQASVDDQVHQALGEREGAVRPFAFPPQGGGFGRRMPGASFGQFGPMLSPFGGMPDPVELAIFYSDALGEKEAAKPALDSVKQKLELGRGGTATDVDAASARLSAAERKVRLLRNIVTTSRAVAAEDVERMRKLGAVRAVSVAQVRNAEARLKILDDILAMDSEAGSKPLTPPAAGEPK